MVEKFGEDIKNYMPMWIVAQVEFAVGFAFLNQFPLYVQAMIVAGEAVVSAMGDSNGQGELKLNVYLDGRQIKASYDRLTRQQGYVIDAGGML